jgi:predicted nucleotidyltransferase
MLDLERVRLRDLAEALEDHSPETSWWFDPETGESEPYVDPDSVDFEDDPPEERGLIRIEPIPSREAYEDMEDGLVDPSVADRELEARHDPELPELAAGFDPVEIAAAAAADLRTLYGSRLRRVLLFGSWARGDAHPDSDIDLLVVLDTVDSPWEELRRMDEILWRHSYQNDAVISAVPVAERTLDDAADPLLIRALAEGRAVA